MVSTIMASHMDNIFKLLITSSADKLLASHNISTEISGGVKQCKHCADVLEEEAQIRKTQKIFNKTYFSDKTNPDPQSLIHPGS